MCRLATLFKIKQIQDQLGLKLPYNGGMSSQLDNYLSGSSQSSAFCLGFHVWCQTKCSVNLNIGSVITL